MENKTYDTAEIARVVSASGLKHIAFIMDGNGRWATGRGLPREMGHKKGAEAFRRALTYCTDIGIEAVTVYAFSTENWKRPEREVNALMHLLGAYVDEAFADLKKNGIRFFFIGDKTALPKALADRLVALENETAMYHKTVNIALNYGGRAEIVHAVNELIRAGKTEVTEDDISASVYTAASGDPDLIVRTASEYRLSNFLLWQAAYSEFWFTDTLWPDFGEKDINEAVVAFAGRKRKYGGLA